MEIGNSVSKEAEARKVELLPLKTKKDNQPHDKTRNQGVLDFLEKRAPMIPNTADPSWVLHLWTDTIICDSPSLILGINHDCDDDGDGKRRAIDVSIAEEPQKMKSTQPRSATNSPGSITKKANPLCKGAHATNNESQRINSFTLSKSQFHTGNCDTLKAGKERSCGCFHYSKQYKTLANVLKMSERNSCEQIRETLAMSKQSYVETIHDDGGVEYKIGGMEMLYYTAISQAKSLPDNSTNSDDMQLLTANKKIDKRHD